MVTRHKVLTALGLALALTACDDGEERVDGGPLSDGGRERVDSSTRDAGGALVVPETYEFESRFVPGASSVAHSGQSARHTLIARLKETIAALDARAAEREFTAGQVVASLNYYYSSPAVDRADDMIELATTPPTLQRTWRDLSGSAILADKVAGRDVETDYRDFSTEFTGVQGAESPAQYIAALFGLLEEQVIDASNGRHDMSPVAQPMRLPVYVTPTGYDLQQLIEKFLLVSLAFHQAADDYLDDQPEDPGKGLLADNTMADGSNNYTQLEHAWDEGFGYFGAAADYGAYSVEEIGTGPRARDTDGDGAIDLTTEYNFGASVNAARRDHDSASGARTQFMTQAWDAFRTGRAIITQAGGALSAEELAALREQRDLAIGAWEAAIAATVVHYLNECLQIMSTGFDVENYDHADFLAHAKAWSEMKGFALAFQFNPRSRVSAADFEQLHALLGISPTLPRSTPETITAARQALRDARAILGRSFGFAAENLGDENGAGGW